MEHRTLRTSNVYCAVQSVVHKLNAVVEKSSSRTLNVVQYKTVPSVQLVQKKRQIAMRKMRGSIPRRTCHNRPVSYE